MKAKTTLEGKREQSFGQPIPVGPTSTAAALATAKFEVGSDTPLRPPLKWAGGKRWLVPHLASLWRPHSARRLVEPFCGGLAVPLGLQPRTAVVNDVNAHLINFYTHLQQGLEMTIEAINEEKTFYRRRKRFNKLIKDDNGRSAEAAQLFYYLNRTCFNGLCRFNKSGEFNVPFGKHKSITYAVGFAEYQSLLKNWVITNLDFAELPIESEDFIYADPPYDVEFTTYSAGGFSWDDQVRAAEWLAAHPGPTVLSNQATSRIIKLYKKLGFQLTYLDAPRRISCTGDRSAAKEVLATKGL